MANLAFTFNDSFTTGRVPSVEEFPASSLELFFGVGTEGAFSESIVRSLVTQPARFPRFVDFVMRGVLTAEGRPPVSPAEADDYISAFLEDVGGDFVSAEEANIKAQESKVELTYTQPIREGVLRDDIRRKKDKQLRDSIAAAATGFAFPFILAGDFIGRLADPIELASAFLPVVGPYRRLKTLSRFGRFKGRTLVGAVDGIVGAAIVEPFIILNAQSTQADYGFQDVFLNIAFGGITGASLHSLGGSFADKITGKRILANSLTFDELENLNSMVIAKLRKRKGLKPGEVPSLDDQPHMKALMDETKRIADKNPEALEVETLKAATDVINGRLVDVDGVRTLSEKKIAFEKAIDDLEDARTRRADADTLLPLEANFRDAAEDYQVARDAFIADLRDAGSGKTIERSRDTSEIDVAHLRDTNKSDAETMDALQKNEYDGAAQEQLDNVEAGGDLLDEAIEGTKLSRAEAQNALGLDAEGKFIEVEAERKQVSNLDTLSKDKKLLKRLSVCALKSVKGGT